MKNSSVFTTTDTALAAFLAVSGVRLSNLNVQEHPAVYYFDYNDSIDDLVRQWESELTPFRQFYNIYRSFIRQIKEKDIA